MPDIPKDWCEKMAKLEDGQEIGAGYPDLLTAAEALRKPCDHVWEYCSGPDDAASFLCSRCEAELIAPVKRSQP